MINYPEFLKKCDKNTGIILFAFFAFGLALRLLNLQFISVMPDYNVFIEGMDYTRFDNLARDILAGKGIEGAYYQAPLYPYFLALVYMLKGASYHSVRTIQCLLDSLNILLIFYICKSRINILTGLISAFTYAVYSVAIFYSSLLLRTSLFTFLWVLFVASFIFAEDRKGKPLFFILPGIALGAAVLCRENILLMLPFTAGALLLNKNISGKVYKRLIPTAIIAICVLVIIFPALCHNYKTEKSICISVMGGANLYIGNAYDSFRGSIVPESYKNISGSKEKVNWYHEFFNSVKTYPRAFFSNLLIKAELFWDNYEIPQNANFYLHKKYSYILSSSFSSFRLIAALALIGFIVYIKKFARIWIIVCSILSVFISCMLFFVLGRLRFPAAPFLIILSSISIDWAATNLFKKKYLPFFIVAATLLFLKMFVWQKGGYCIEKTHITNLGIAALQKNELDTAEFLFKKAMPENGDAPFLPAHMLLAETYRRKGMYEEASAEYLYCIKINPESQVAHYNIGICYLGLKNKEKAGFHFNKALDLSNNNIRLKQEIDRLYRETEN
ncbi:glycosyltransferase family 39 protein [bacterium]|jgi:tetratricopeptide (TPR) repeat protein|nr:glycosyltransferase family 39 protein [bacterium]